MNLLEGWENFYIIVGSSAGALIGLQFVVITLIADMPITQSDLQAGSSVFTTPSVIHFSVVLFLSAIISIPWDSIGIIAFLWGIVGVGGLGYAMIVTRRFARQTAYKPVFEDWLFHALLPLAAYAMIAISAGLAWEHPRCALFGIGGASLLMLFIGIHNAWDTVTHLIFVRRQQQQEESGGPEKNDPKTD